MARYTLVLNNVGWMGDPSRGVALGRRDELPADAQTAIRLHLTRLRWVDGDYDEGGNYWGRSFKDNRPALGYAAEWIYCAEGMREGEYRDEYARLFVRATSREDAKAQILAKLPAARFYR